MAKQHSHTQWERLLCAAHVEFGSNAFSTNDLITMLDSKSGVMSDLQGAFLYTSTKDKYSMLHSLVGSMKSNGSLKVVEPRRGNGGSTCVVNTEMVERCCGCIKEQWTRMITNSIFPPVAASLLSCLPHSHRRRHHPR